MEKEEIDILALISVTIWLVSAITGYYIYDFGLTFNQGLIISTIWLALTTVIWYIIKYEK